MWFWHQVDQGQSILSNSCITTFFFSSNQSQKKTFSQNSDNIDDNNSNDIYILPLNDGFDIGIKCQSAKTMTIIIWFDGKKQQQHFFRQIVTSKIRIKKF